MTIYFREIFKKLRKNRNLTQEQIAEVLSVSPQAVSRWETGATYPDIALLPSIAEFFETTVDALLGTGKARAEERIAGFLRHSEELALAGELAEACDLMRSAVKEFPNHYELQYHLLSVLLKMAEAGHTYHVSDSEVIEIGERILTYATDDRIRLLTKVHLGRHFHALGQSAKAREIFMTLPEEAYCREAQLHFVLGDEIEGYGDVLAVISAEPMPAPVRTEDAVDFSVMKLFESLKQGDEERSPKDRLAEAKRRLQLLDEVYSNSDFGGHYLEHAAVCTAEMAMHYAACGDANRALLCLSKAVECAEESALTPLSDTYFSHADASVGSPRSLAEQIRDDLLTDPCFDGIRNNASFPSL